MDVTVKRQKNCIKESKAMQNPELITREMGSKVVQLGSSLVVPCVQELAKVNTAAIPPRYVRRPHQEQPTIIPSCEIPVVDLQRLLDQESMDPELPKLHLACKDGGSVQEEQQINVEVSRATTAEEEAQGKGSVDGIMEVQEVTESSGPLQSRSLNGIASAHSFRQRHGFKEKSKLEQVVIKVNLDSSKACYLALKHAAGIAGVESVELGGPDRNLLEVMVDEVDGVHLVNLLQKKFGNAKLISPGPVKEPMKDIMEDEPVPIREEENGPVLQPSVSSSSPHCLHPIREVQSAVDTVKTKKLNGAMEMETKANTHSNLSLENAESSCKSKTAEWTIPITSLLLEAISVIFDQLGDELTSMVLAYVALLLSILDIIHKDREKEGTAHDGRSLLPCFHRHDLQNHKLFGGLVECYGFASAVWQCIYTTVGYHYSRQNLDNPIKICLLPFIFALCVLIFKTVKSSKT